MKKRINGDIEVAEWREWQEQMTIDGFKSMWTWICWLIRQRIQQTKKEAVRKSDGAEVLSTPAPQK